MADTRVLDIDQDLIWPRLLHWNLLVLNGTAGLLNNTGPLLLWDFRAGLGLGWFSESGKGCHFVGVDMVKVFMDGGVEMEVCVFANGMGRVIG